MTERIWGRIVTTRHRPSHVSRRLAVAFSVYSATFILLCASCTSTSQTRQVETSGFLGDYSALRRGKGDEPQLIYVNPSVKFHKYTKILMDPIVVYASSEDSRLNRIPADELQSIVNYLDATVREQLSLDYAFADRPQPDTMRLRIAITEAKGAKVVLSTASSVTPVGLALNVIKKGVTGESTGVGEARCEMELLDSQARTRLAAAVDSRVGTDVALTALRELHIECMAAGQLTREKLKLGNVILAAPDLDFEVVTQRVGAEGIFTVPRRMTVYISPEDKAIGLSSWLFDSLRRIGRLRLTDLSLFQRKSMKSIPDLEVVDARTRRADPFGHSYFYQSPAVSSDLILILRDDCSAGTENGRPLGREEGSFWMLTDDYPQVYN